MSVDLWKPPTKPESKLTPHALSGELAAVVAAQYLLDVVGPKMGSIQGEKRHI